MKPLAYVVYFPSDSAVTSADHDTLVAIKAAATQPNVQHILLIGATDPHGSAAHNQQLAQQRAEAVQNWLVREGVKSRLVIVGTPLFSSDPRLTDAERRRVDILILGQ